MKKVFSTLFVLSAVISFAQNSFYKRCLVTSITRGPSAALISSKSNDGYKHSEVISGAIDPLIMEYGITDKIGVGFSIGGENYGVDINKFYKANVSEPDNMMNLKTQYFTKDISYHFLRSKRIDASAFSGIGYYTVSGSMYSGPYSYGGYEKSFRYKGRGGVLRGGLRTRFYYSKHFGLMAMVYGFQGITQGKPVSAKAISDGKPASNYTTSLRGVGLEFGLCMRLFKQKGLPVKNTAEEEEEKEPLIRFSWD